MKRTSDSAGSLSAKIIEKSDTPKWLIYAMLGLIGLLVLWSIYGGF